MPRRCEWNDCRKWPVPGSKYCKEHVQANQELKRASTLDAIAIEKLELKAEAGEATQAQVIQRQRKSVATLSAAEQAGGAAPAKTVAPTEADMEKAKLLYVTLKMDYTTNPDVPNVDSLKYALSEGGLTKTWAAVPGLRHKYFIYDHEEEVCSGVYVFYTEQALTDYMASDLFKAQGTYPHVSKVVAEVKDVIPGTELAIEKTSWAHTPPTRDDVSVAKMLVVDITMDFTTGVEGLPTKKEELYGFMAAPPNGMGYPAQFGELEGLRGKYFAYDASIGHCYGFYTFVDQASLDKYMASDLFKKQGEPPHIKALTYKVHDVLPGTEASMDLGEWGSN